MAAPVLPVTERHDEQGPARVLPERADAGKDGVLRGSAGEERVAERDAPNALARRETERDLAQRERVAARDVDDLRDHGRRQLVAETPLEEGQRRGSVEGLKLDDLGRAERSRVAACRDEQRDPFRSDPSCDERQRLERGVVEQVRVVDANKKWVFLRRCGKQPQRAGVRGESIAPLGSGEAEGRRQRLAKGVREGADPAEQRPAQFLEPRVRALAHVLDTGNPEDAHPVGALRGGVEQRCLPDPGLTADHNRAAAAGPGLVEHPADALLLTGTTKEPLIRDRGRSRAARSRGRAPVGEGILQPAAEQLTGGLLEQRHRARVLLQEACEGATSVTGLERLPERGPRVEPITDVVVRGLQMALDRIRGPPNTERLVFVA